MNLFPLAGRHNALLLLNTRGSRVRWTLEHREGESDRILHGRPVPPGQRLRLTIIQPRWSSSKPDAGNSLLSYNPFVMFDSARLLLFLTAAVLLAVAPGPGMLYVLARSLAGGKREGVLSALGTFLGGMVHVFAAALGVSVILARSALAFSTVKYVGAAYLCFLGVRMILDAREKEKYSTDDVPLAAGVAARNPLWHGGATEVLNAK